MELSITAGVCAVCRPRQRSGLRFVCRMRPRPSYQCTCLRAMRRASSIGRAEHDLRVMFATTTQISCGTLRFPVRLSRGSFGACSQISRPHCLFARARQSVGAIAAGRSNTPMARTHGAGATRYRSVSRSRLQSSDRARQATRAPSAYSDACRHLDPATRNQRTSRLGPRRSA